VLLERILAHRSGRELSVETTAVVIKKELL
jgi:hypothetical protein